MFCCGGKALFEVAEELLEGGKHRQHHGHEGGKGRGEREARRHELRMMYARGEIDRETYHRLKHQAQGELPEKRPAAPEAVLEPRVPLPRDREIEAGLAQLQRQKEHLDQAQRESRDTLRELEQRVAQLRTEIARSEERAKDTLPNDEARARDYLMRKQLLQQQVDGLTERAASLRESIEKADDLRQQLEVREAELKAAQSGQRLAALEVEFKEKRLDRRSNRGAV